jgi:N-ethylmaleimide reductase
MPFEPFEHHGRQLRNRATTDHPPTPMMAEYYAQRGSMGLIISEGTSQSADGLGYARIPGLFSEAQVSGWKTVTDAVHAKSGTIMAQLMRCGNASHVDDLLAGARIVSPTSVPLPESI